MAISSCFQTVCPLQVPTSLLARSLKTTTTWLGAQVVCFSASARIDTPSGPRAVETLTKGDLVLTANDRVQPLRWAGATTVAAQGAQTPIVITAGTLGNTENLVVSSQNCILLSDWRAELLYGQDEVLVRPVDLLNIDGVYRHTGGMVTYCQI